MASDDDEQVLRDLQDAVARVSAAVRAKTARDVLIGLPDPKERNAALRVAAAFGFRIFQVNDSAEAAASAAGRRFDLIVISAAEAPLWARRIRAVPETGAAPAIVALGAGNAPAWREEAAEAGIDGIITLPVTTARLVEIIMLLMGAPADGDDETLREA